MKRLFALLLWALPAFAQTPIAIQNPSFEVGGAALGAQGWNYGPVPSWTFAGSGPFGLTNVTTAPDGGTTVWSNGGTFSQDLGVALRAGQIYTASIYLSNRYDGLKPTASLSLLAGTKEICAASFAPTASAFTFVQMTLACPTPAVIPAGNLSIKFGSDSRQILFDKVSLTSASSIPPQPDSVHVLGELLWCSLCFDPNTVNPDGTVKLGAANHTTDTPATGNLVITQTGGPQATFPIAADGTVVASGTIDLAQDPIELTFMLTDATGTPQPGATLMTRIPNWEAKAALVSGTIFFGVIRNKHITDAGGNPAAQFVDLSNVSLR